jgi:hypothetical protein
MGHVYVKIDYSGKNMPPHSRQNRESWIRPLICIFIKKWEYVPNFQLKTEMDRLGQHDLDRVKLLTALILLLRDAPIL